MGIARRASWCSGTAHERDFPSELYSGPWKIRAMNGSPSCTGRIRRFALSCILDERRRAEGRKEDTRDMKFWSQVYVGSGIGSYPDPAGWPVASECVKTWFANGSIARFPINPDLRLSLDKNIFPSDSRRSCRWSKHWKEKRKKERRRRRKICIFILIHANTKRVSLYIRIPFHGNENTIEYSINPFPPRNDVILSFPRKHHVSKIT